MHNLSEIAKQLGKRGGEQTRKRGPEYYREIGRKGLKTRWTRRGKKAKEV